MTATSGFTSEERRLRVHMARNGIKFKTIADNTGLFLQDVSAVIRGKSKSPRYIAEVYKYLGLEQPGAELENARQTATPA